MCRCAGSLSAPSARSGDPVLVDSMCPLVESYGAVEDLERSKLLSGDEGTQ